MIRLPPRSTPFPSTALFRSPRRHHATRGARVRSGRQREGVLRGRGSARRKPRGYGDRRPGAVAVHGPGTYASDHRPPGRPVSARARSEEHTSELQSPCNLVCRLLLEKKKKKKRAKNYID